MCQTDHQHRLQGVTKKAVKKGLVAANWDWAALDNGIIMQNYQGLCQKHKALQEESVLIVEELESADAEVKKLQEKNEAVVAEVKKLQLEKYGLLDQLLVFEGLSVDPDLPFKIWSGHCHISHDDSWLQFVNFMWRSIIIPGCEGKLCKNLFAGCSCHSEFIDSWTVRAWILFEGSIFCFLP